MEYGLFCNKEIIIRMAKNSCSSGSIADKLSFIGVMTTETQLNMFIKELGIERGNVIKKRRFVKDTYGKGMDGIHNFPNLSKLTFY